MRKRPEFKEHDDFIFGLKKIGKVTREEFIKYVRSTHDKMRKLTQIIQQYDQTIKEWVSKFDLFESAESVRVVNEEERISKDSERDSKIYSLGERIEENEEGFEQHKLRYVEQVEVPVTNLTTNGDFRDGANGWVASGGTLEIQEGGVVFTLTRPAWNNLIRSSSQVNVSIGKYYWRVVANTPIGSVDFRLGNVSNVQGGEPGTFDVYSNVVKVDSDISSYNGIYIDGAGQPVNTQIIIKNVLTINLTATFGAGNEPTAEQMDKLIEQFPNNWFDGTVNIYNSKHMMAMFFKELTKLNNAITTLGGNV